MLFITNRFPTQSIKTRLGRAFDFDLKNNASSNSVFYCRRLGAGKYEEIGGFNLMSELKSSPYRQLLIYIHGFSNLPEAVFDGAAEFQALCDKQKKNEVLVLPIVWPCDDDLGIIQDYWDDQQSADASAFSLARVLQHFMKWREDAKLNPADDPCLKRINMLAHSMGNRVLRETLCAWDKYGLPSGVPLIFRNTYLVAADIENESVHKGERGELISHASRNVVVYFASDDLALRSSKVANLKNKVASRRLGHTGPENMTLTPANVYAVDCDDVNTAYDTPKGHSYFRSGKRKGEPGKVFEHIWGTLMTGRVYPDDEFRRRSIIRD
jgi:esterase/lipase superfamily enzyme